MDATVVGNLAMVATMLLFLSGISICSRIWENNGTVGISALPMLTAFISCFLWLYYGNLKKDTDIQLVNAFGLLMQTLYILFYLAMTSNKSLFFRKIFITVAIPLLIIYMLNVQNGGSAQNELTRQVGLVSCVASLIFFSSPLASVVSVIRTRNTSSMPGCLIFLSCLQSLLWYLYGNITDDLYVQIPNLLGTLITFFELCLLCWIPLTDESHPNEHVNFC